MLHDLSGAECLELICDISEAIKCELDVLIVVSLEVVEEVVKDTDPLISLSLDAFVDLGSRSQTSLAVSSAPARPYCPLVT